MHQRRSGLDRRQRIEDGRQIVVLDADAPQRLVGQLATLGRHRGDLLADEPDLAARQHRHVAHVPANSRVGRQISSDQHGVHAQLGLRVAGIPGG